MVGRHDRAVRNRRSLRILAVVWVPTIVLLALIWTVRSIDTEVLMGDPAAIAELPKYLGFFSHVSVLAWTVAAVIFFATAAVLRLLGSSSRAVAMCLFAGAILTVLMLDDWLQLHESASRRGVPQASILGLYAIVVIIWLVSFDEEIARTPFSVLIAGGAMFAISVTIDVFFERSDGRWRLLAEDGAKILGILAMAVYAAGAARAFISDRAASLAATTADDRPPGA